MFDVLCMGCARVDRLRLQGLRLERGWREVLPSLWRGAQRAPLQIWHCQTMRTETQWALWNHGAGQRNQNAKGKRFQDTGRHGLDW